ncbi:MAG: hypothetical protein CM1200mP30_32920 [Pseudomonadota bacterium]|nr:MAG: hypothetical protein CM1200mP30_32920 [Pseudomonadota bacterium]
MFQEAVRRNELVPTVAPLGKFSILPYFGQIQASRGSSLSAITEISSPSGKMLVTSFMLCTARSALPSSKAFSRSLTKSPFPPISARGCCWLRSPAVVTVNNSTFISVCCSRIFPLPQICLPKREDTASCCDC